MACWLADYLEWLQFCWDFVKPPRNDEIALQHFFLACSSARIFFLFPLCCMQFFSSKKCLQEIFFQNHPPPPPQELNGRPLKMIDLVSFNKSLKTTWIKKILGFHEQRKMESFYRPSFEKLRMQKYIYW